MAQQSAEIINLHSTNLPNGMSAEEWQAQIQRQLHAKYYMIIGEGSVFLGIMLIGIFQVRKAFKKESELLARQKTFLHSVTHEFKSPVASLRLQIETLLKRNLSNEQQQQALGNALEDTDRLDHLLEKILMAARIDNGELPMHPEKMNLSERLHDNLGKLLRTYPQRDIKENIQENVYSNIDPWAFNSIVNNLVENALIYSPKDKAVEVELKKEGNKLILQVKDNGPGIPMAERRQIFQKFYRMSTSSGYKGTGLGLYLVDYFVRKHNGTILIRDNSPQGSIFEITLQTL